MPVFDTGKYQSMLESYIPQKERNIFGGRLTLRDAWNVLMGSPKDQVMGFTSPVAIPVAKMPAAVQRFVQPGEEQMLRNYAKDVPQAVEMMLQHRMRNPISYEEYSRLLNYVGDIFGGR